MLLASLLLSASAATVDINLVEKRLTEVAPLRAQRLSQDAPPIEPTFYVDAANGSTPSGLTVVQGHKAKKAVAVTVADASIGQMWAAINDESSKVSWTKLSYIEVFEGENCKSGRKVLQYLPVSFVTNRWWVVKQTQNQPLSDASGGRMREVRWDSIDERPTSATSQSWMSSGMSLAFTTGSWLLIDLDGEHTLVEYYTWSDPGGNIPAGMASNFAAGSLADTLVKMGELAKAGSKCPVE
ncbi:MAG: hypothetical protein GWP91_17270 [Rhodobacterales bacterium]|nr:hypothetical protein [Rhodobacterales bacterium]